MSADVQPWSGRNATCPKRTAQMTPVTRFEPANGFSHIGGLYGVATPEHEYLTRECAVCMFTWVELCADHPA